MASASKLKTRTSNWEWAWLCQAQRISVVLQFRARDVIGWRGCGAGGSTCHARLSGYTAVKVGRFSPRSLRLLLIRSGSGGADGPESRFLAVQAVPAVSPRLCVDLDGVQVGTVSADLWLLHKLVNGGVCVCARVMSPTEFHKYV